MAERPRSYTVVRQGSLDELVEAVNDALTQGWIPQGGIEVEPVGNKQLFYQAMVRFL